jgi:hypothetical protein
MVSVDFAFAITAAGPPIFGPTHPIGPASASLPAPAPAPEIRHTAPETRLSCYLDVW